MLPVTRSVILSIFFWMIFSWKLEDLVFRVRLSFELYLGYRICLLDALITND